MSFELFSIFFETENSLTVKAIFILWAYYGQYLYFGSILICWGFVFI